MIWELNVRFLQLAGTFGGPGFSRIRSGLQGSGPKAQSVPRGTHGDGLLRVSCLPEGSIRLVRPRVGAPKAIRSFPSISWTAPDESIGHPSSFLGRVCRKSQDPVQTVASASRTHADLCPTPRSRRRRTHGHANHTPGTIPSCPAIRTVTVTHRKNHLHVPLAGRGRPPPPPSISIYIYTR